MSNFLIGRIDYASHNRHRLSAQSPLLDEFMERASFIAPGDKSLCILFSARSKDPV
jgi:hypothetical protein